MTAYEDAIHTEDVMVFSSLLMALVGDYLENRGADPLCFYTIADGLGMAIVALEETLKHRLERLAVYPSFEGRVVMCAAKARELNSLPKG